MDSDKHCHFCEGAYLQNCVLWAVSTSFSVFIITWDSDIFMALEISLHILCQEIVGLKAFSFKKQNSTANQCEYNMGRVLYGYSEMSWNTWALLGSNGTGSFQALFHLSLLVFFSLLFFSVHVFPYFPFAYGHFSVLFDAFCSQQQPHSS